MFLQACGVVCFGGVLCICTDVYMYELVHTWLEACWCYVADWLFFNVKYPLFLSDFNET